MRYPKLNNRKIFCEMLNLDVSSPTWFKHPYQKYDLSKFSLSFVEWHWSNCKITTLTLKYSALNVVGHLCFPLLRPLLYWYITVMSHEHHETQITGKMTVSNVCLVSHIKKNERSHYWPFVTIIYRWPLKSPHKGPVTRKPFPFDDVIIICYGTLPISLRVLTNEFCSILKDISRVVNFDNWQRIWKYQISDNSSLFVCKRQLE